MKDKSRFFNSKSLTTQYCLNTYKLSKKTCLQVILQPSVDLYQSALLSMPFDVSNLKPFLQIILMQTESIVDIINILSR